MRLNETALIPQRAMGIRVGQRGKIKTVAYPTCDHCSKDALVSLTVPTEDGVKTTHRCVDHLTPKSRLSEKRRRETEVLEILSTLGVLA